MLTVRLPFCLTSIDNAACTSARGRRPMVAPQACLQHAFAPVEIVNSMPSLQVEQLSTCRRHQTSKPWKCKRRPRPAELQEMCTCESPSKIDAKGTCFMPNSCPTKRCPAREYGRGGWGHEDYRCAHEIPPAMEEVRNLSASTFPASAVKRSIMSSRANSGCPMMKECALLLKLRVQCAGMASLP